MEERTAAQSQVSRDAGAEAAAAAAAVSPLQPRRRARAQPSKTQLQRVCIAMETDKKGKPRRAAAAAEDTEVEESDGESGGTSEEEPANAGAQRKRKRSQAAAAGPQDREVYAMLTFYLSKRSLGSAERCIKLWEEGFHGGPPVKDLEAGYEVRPGAGPAPAWRRGKDKAYQKKFRLYRRMVRFMEVVVQVAAAEQPHLAPLSLAGTAELVDRHWRQRYPSLKQLFIQKLWSGPIAASYGPLPDVFEALPGWREVADEVLGLREVSALEGQPGREAGAAAGAEEAAEGGEEGAAAGHERPPPRPQRRRQPGHATAARGRKVQPRPPGQGTPAALEPQAAAHAAEPEDAGPASGAPARRGGVAAARVRKAAVAKAAAAGRKRRAASAAKAGAADEETVGVEGGAAAGVQEDSAAAEWSEPAAEGQAADAAGAGEGAPLAAEEAAAQCGHQGTPSRLTRREEEPESSGYTFPSAPAARSMDGDDTAAGPAGATELQGKGVTSGDQKPPVDAQLLQRLLKQGQAMRAKRVGVGFEGGAADVEVKEEEGVRLEDELQQGAAKRQRFA